MTPLIGIYEHEKKRLVKADCQTVKMLSGVHYTNHQRLVLLLFLYDDSDGLCITLTLDNPYVCMLALLLSKT